MDFGWIAVRNVPLSDKKGVKERHDHYFQILQKFFSKYRLCPDCMGTGYIENNKPRKKERANIKFRGISDLEALHVDKNSPARISDVIREVIAFELEGRLPCKKCRGMKFVKRSTK